MNKRVLILTGTTDIKRNPNEIDSTMEEVFDLTLQSKIKYAKKYGYDILALRSFGKDQNNVFTNTEIGFLRELRAFDMLKHYDVVMWIDADSIITNDNFSIDDFELDDDHCFYASWDWTGKLSFSTGNFIIKNAPSTEHMFKAFLSVGNYVKDNKHWGEEQTTMNIIMNSTSLGKNIKVLDHKYLNSIPGKNILGSIWGSDRPEPKFPWSNDSFLVHLTGISNTERINLIKTHFSRFI